METTSSLIIYLLLSLSSVGPASALQNPLLIQSVNKELQNQIDRALMNSLSIDLYFQLEGNPLSVEQDKIRIKQPEFFHVPDCLCQLSTRVM